MKRLIISVLMLMAATFIFSQGNSDIVDQNAQQDVIKTEQIFTEFS